MDDMAVPRIVTEIVDAKTSCTLRFFAYRKLSEAEMRQGVALWLRKNRRKTLPRNRTISIYSIHGFDG